MKTFTVGNSSLVTSRLAYGCWRIAGWEGAELTPEREAHARAAVLAAYENGFTFFDHADVYSDGRAESIFGQVMSGVSGMRERVQICTKCGVRKAGPPNSHVPYRYDLSASHITQSCEASLKRLGVEKIDLFLLHRPDYLADLDEVASAFASLRAAGKVGEFGVSNFRPGQFSALQKRCGIKLVANQIEISLSRVDSFHDGTLDQCQEFSVTPLAWSPLGGGRLVNHSQVDMMDRDHANRLRLRETLDMLARERGVSRSSLALAWLLRHPAGILPIIGATSPDNIKECAKAVDVEISREEWYRLMEAGVGHRLP